MNWFEFTQRRCLEEEEEDRGDWLSFGPVDLEDMKVKLPQTRQFLRNSNRVALEQVLKKLELKKEEVMNKVNKRFFLQVMQFVKDATNGEEEDNDNDGKASDEEEEEHESRSSQSDEELEENKSSEEGSLADSESEAESDESDSESEKEEEMEEEEEESVINQPKRVKTLETESDVDENELRFVNREFSNDHLDELLNSFIPTALIVGGHDAADNEIMLNSLSQRLKNKKARRIVHFSSRENLNKTKKSFLDLIAYSINNSHCKNSLACIEQWCRGKQDINRSIIVVVEGSEDFDRQTLQKLVRTLSFLKQERQCSIILLVSISCFSGEQSLHNNLTREEIRKLFIRKFRPIESSKVFKELLYAVFVEACLPIKFSRGAMQFFLSKFFDEDFSLYGFMQNVKFAIIDHYIREPGAFLCQAPNISTRSPEEHADRLVEKFNSEIHPYLGKKEFGVPHTSIEELREDLLRMEINRRYFPTLLKFLVLVGIRLKCYASENEADVMSLILREGVPLKEYMTKLSVASLHTLDEIKALAEQLLPAEYYSASIKEAWDKKDFMQEEPAVSQKATTTTASNLFSATKTKKLSIAEKRKQQFASILQNSKSQGIDKNTIDKDKLGNLREKVKTFVQTVIVDGLYAYKQSKLQIVYKHVTTLEGAFSASIVNHVCHALSFPRKHGIECSCCCDEEINKAEEFLDTMDDIVVAFKTLRGVGNLREVGMLDWYHSFIDGINEEEDTKNKKRTLVYRFTRAICELQYLGFWKPDSKELVKKLNGVEGW